RGGSPNVRPCREVRVQLVAFQTRQRLGQGNIVQLSKQPHQDAAADLRVRDLAPAEEDDRLHLVSIGQEALDVALLELVIVLVDLRAELDFLHLDGLLVLPRLALALLFRVLVLPVIGDPAHGRRGGGRHLDEVEALLPCERDGLRRRHDAELRARLIDHPYFTNTDALVDPDPVVPSGTTHARVVRDNSLLAWRADAQPSLATHRHRLRSVYVGRRPALAGDFGQRILDERGHGAAAAI